MTSLRNEGIVRRIGASFSSRHLGYTSTLCAMAVPGSEKEVDRIASLVSAHAEVTHNYLRTGAFNIWFTVIAPQMADIDRVVDKIRQQTGYEVLNLPAKNIFKIKVDFSGPTGEDSAPKNDNSAPFDANSPFDIAVLKAVQGDIGESLFPFEGLGLDEDKLLARLCEWKADGTVRRFGAFVRHQKMGFTFNGMSVWNVPLEDCASIGRSFAAFPFVSHCYERPRSEGWPYNLYAMVHDKTKEGLEAHLALMRELSGLDCEVLVSLKEYKKTSPIYFT